MSNVHLIIPDTQVKPGVPIDHLKWAGKYLIENRPDVVIHIGDHADMPSLSSWDRGKKDMENRRYMNDIEAANTGFDELMAPMHKYNAMRTKNKKKQYTPRLEFMLGNHEDRITRFVDSNPILENTLSLDDLNYKDHGFNVNGYRNVIEIDGVLLSHFFYNPRTGHPWAGMIDTRIKNIGSSFTQGHLQGKMVGEIQRATGKIDRGLVVGSFYLHDEKYLGPQGSGEWRGIIIKYDVQDGQYDLEEISIKRLCMKYEQMPLDKFLKDKYNI